MENTVEFLALLTELSDSLEVIRKNPRKINENMKPISGKVKKLYNLLFSEEPKEPEERPEPMIILTCAKCNTRRMAREHALDDKTWACPKCLFLNQTKESAEYAIPSSSPS